MDKVAKALGSLFVRQKIQNVLMTERAIVKKDMDSLLLVEKCSY